MDDAVEYIYSKDRSRRVTILRKSTGGYAYREERYYKSGETEGWAALWSQSSLYDSIETAKREVVFAVPWLTSDNETA